VTHLHALGEHIYFGRFQTPRNLLPTSFPKAIPHNKTTRQIVNLSTLGAQNGGYVFLKEVFEEPFGNFAAL
jgi:hypothetical protein